MLFPLVLVDDLDHLQQIASPLLHYREYVRRNPARIVPSAGAEPLRKAVCDRRETRASWSVTVLLLDPIHELRDAVEAAVLGVLFDGATELRERRRAQRRAI